MNRRKNLDKGPETLFNKLLIVQLDTTTFQPSLAYQWIPPKKNEKDEEKEDDNRKIQQFCFPESQEELSNILKKNEEQVNVFSFVLTDSYGGKTIAYCKRIMRSSEPICFCIISKRPYFKLFEKLLILVQDRYDKRLTSNNNTLLTTLFSQAIPKSSTTIEFKTITASQPEEHILPFLKPKTNFDHIDYEIIYKMNPVHIIKLFEFALCESRVILLSKNISVLSNGILALSSLLYPLIWQHIFISILPSSLMPYVAAPIPFIVGILESSLKLFYQQPTEQVILYDLDKLEFIIDPHTKSLLPYHIRIYLDNYLKNLKINYPTYNNDFEDSYLRKPFYSVIYHLFKNYTAYMLKNGVSYSFFKDQFLEAPVNLQNKKLLEVVCNSQMVEVFFGEKEFEFSESGQVNCTFLNDARENTDDIPYISRKKLGLLDCKACCQSTISYPNTLEIDGQFLVHAECLMCRTCECSLSLDERDKFEIKKINDGEAYIKIYCTDCRSKTLLNKIKNTSSNSKQKFYALFKVDESSYSNNQIGNTANHNHQIFNNLLNQNYFTNNSSGSNNNSNHHNNHHHNHSHGQKDHHHHHKDHKEHKDHKDSNNNQRQVFPASSEIQNFKFKKPSQTNHQIKSSTFTGLPTVSSSPSLSNTLQTNTLASTPNNTNNSKSSLSSSGGSLPPPPQTTLNSYHNQNKGVGGSLASNLMIFTNNNNNSNNNNNNNSLKLSSSPSSSDTIKFSSSPSKSSNTSVPPPPAPPSKPSIKQSSVKQTPPSSNKQQKTLHASNLNNSNSNSISTLTTTITSTTPSKQDRFKPPLPPTLGERKERAMEQIKQRNIHVVTIDDYYSDINNGSNNEEVSNINSNNNSNTLSITVSNINSINNTVPSISPRKNQQQQQQVPPISPRKNQQPQPQPQPQPQQQQQQQVPPISPRKNQNPTPPSISPRKQNNKITSPPAVPHRNYNKPSPRRSKTPPPPSTQDDDDSPIGINKSPPVISPRRKSNPAALQIYSKQQQNSEYQFVNSQGSVKKPLPNPKLTSTTSNQNQQPAPPPRQLPPKLSKPTTSFTKLPDTSQFKKYAAKPKSNDSQSIPTLTTTTTTNNSNNSNSNITNNNNTNKNLSPSKPTINLPVSANQSNNSQKTQPPPIPTRTTPPKTSPRTMVREFNNNNIYYHNQTQVPSPTQPQAIPQIQQVQQQSQSPEKLSPGSSPRRLNKICFNCQIPLNCKTPIKMANNNYYHSECFICKYCNLPVQKDYFFYQGSLYHIACSEYILPVCKSCSTCIHGKFLEDFQNVKFHEECFKCCECGNSLTSGYQIYSQNYYCKSCGDLK